MHMDIFYDSSAVDDLRKMPAADAKRLREALRQVADLHPQRLGFVTELQGHPGYWRARKGKWRAVFIMGENAITVIAAGKRAEIYK